MVRGLATISYDADDLAAKAWYSALLEIEPSFVRLLATEPVYCELRGSHAR